MFYCEKCLSLRGEGRCPSCKQSVRPVEAGDFCLLTEKAVMWADMLRDLLKENGIDSVYHPVLGAGLSMYSGRSLDRHRIYVPYSQYEQAQEVLSSFFSEECIVPDEE